MRENKNACKNYYNCNVETKVALSAWFNSKKMSRMLETFVRLFGVAFSSFVSNQTSLGVDGAILCNEIMLTVNPKIAAHGQWIELHNTGMTDVSLRGWFVKASANQNLTDKDYRFSFSAMIVANGYLTIEKTLVSGYVDLAWSAFSSFSSKRQRHCRLQCHFPLQ